MKFEKLQPGMVVYDVGRSKMGNTTYSTVSVWTVKIISVNKDDSTVTASWNGNAERTYSNPRSWKRWREKRPMLVLCPYGAYRLAKRDEISAAKAKKND